MGQGQRSRGLRSNNYSRQIQVGSQQDQVALKRPVDKNAISKIAFWAWLI